MLMSKVEECEDDKEFDKIRDHANLTCKLKTLEERTNVEFKIQDNVS